MNDINQKISNNIRNIREGKRIKQLYMARRLNITQQAYSRIENYPEKSTLERLLMIAKILEVDLITLLAVESKHIQQNFNQQGGNAATHLVQNYTSDERNDLYERIIAELKEEINYLRLLHKR
jgi:transcriptional regulator with XRE-family HTH domain